MHWDAIGAIGEIIGAIAVVVTLIYFSLQIRQYDRGLRSSTFHATMHEFNQINIQQLDPPLTGLMEQGLADPESLTETEKHQFGWIMRVEEEVANFVVTRTVHNWHDTGAEEAPNTYHVFGAGQVTRIKGPE